MIKQFSWSLAVFCLLIFTASCDRPECNNTNPIFDKYSPEAKEYKNELVKQLKLVNYSTLTFWMDKYQEKDGLQYLHTHIQGDNLCAKIVLVVRESTEGIEWLLKHKGMGYRGAEFKDLKFDIYQDSSKTEFVFKELGRIVD